MSAAVMNAAGASATRRTSASLQRATRAGEVRDARWARPGFVAFTASERESDMSAQAYAGAAPGTGWEAGPVENSGEADAPRFASIRVLCHGTLAERPARC
ncbi:hypothetical protein GCM10011490_17690 [Pseudoclavibacter endophyticus]|nr:hypothetical protein GCM10011490_17690 [Pseudoclavibacter endophyticus]